MTDKAADKLKADGWKIVETSGFLHLIGPLWQRMVDGESRIRAGHRGQAPQPPRPGAGRRADDLRRPHLRHDRPLCLRQADLATVQLDVHFVDAGKIGEILVSRPHVVRIDPQSDFHDHRSDGRQARIAMASGVFKILKNES